MALEKVSITTGYNGLAATEVQTIAVDGDHTVTYSDNSGGSGGFPPLKVYHRTNTNVAFPSPYIFEDFDEIIFDWNIGDEVYFVVPGMQTGDDVGLSLDP